MTARYYITLPDPEQARAAGPFAFRSHSAEGLAEELQDALRGDALFQRWLGAQDDPDATDGSLAAVDPQASVKGEQHDLHVDLIVVTAIPGAVFRHRMGLLAGSAWRLHDVSSA
ncbi:hypothetical protein CSC70_03185 [Pseudoxanthomonas kalamensis DSM 18571]|uniref:hypothetical protein n=1 Tax=Pseudoxanthomonas kalamensis TaxID=289483 RepID=UPI0013910441|nr:hypothetical protein [Pseudoxanthomonas kalamensis]KAF1712531.1 hypothetical protein CSC70_03185 [Pseudoxanthomonas kalamensis DSM 18571]